MKSNGYHCARLFSASVAIFILTVIFNATIFAQTTAFTYQGRLSDGAAAAASGVYDLEFKLYDGGGTQIGATLTKDDISVSNGAFTTELDFGAAAFDGSPRTLEISVRRGAETGAFTTLTPRQTINSTPYAIRALNASTVEMTAGNSVVDSINDSSTSVTVNSNRLSADVVRMNPAETQNSTSTDSSAAVLDVSGATSDTNNVFGTSRFRFNHDGGFFAAGQPEFGNLPTSGAGARMMWYPGKWAFRAGKVDSFGATYWDEANIGFGSAALGENVRASGNNSFAAGLATTASGHESTAFGNNSTASADRSFAFNGTASAVGAVAIGSGAQATNDDALAMGPSSIAGGLASIVIGPSIANGNFGIAIGLQNSAAGQFSVAIGKNARTCSHYQCGPGTPQQGAIVISDACAQFSSDAVTASANNQVNIRGCGGFRFFTNMNLSAGVELAPSGNQWLSLSDRNSKENFQAVNSRDILRKVLNLPITTWNYKSQNASIRHIGAMAQDFKAAFAVGEDDRHISALDPDGVAFAAIQGLNEELKEQTANLKADNNRLRLELKAQSERLAVIEAKLNETAKRKPRLNKSRRAAVKRR